MTGSERRQNEPNDAELLERFLGDDGGRRAAEDAFRQLVDRYLGMVFSVAMRSTGDRAAAEEIAQNVFASLARRGRKLRSAARRHGGSVGGWLHRVAAIEAAEAMRKEYRRKRAMTELTQQAEELSSETEMREASEGPELDSAIAALSRGDREALVLRFHGGLKFREIADRIGSSEDAARKRVTRALSRLASSLERRRAPASVAMLGAAVAALLADAASPAGMASRVSAGALAAAGNSGAGAAGMKLMLMTMNETQKKLAAMAAIAMILGSVSFVAGRRAAADFGAEIAGAMPAMHHANASPANRSARGGGESAAAKEPPAAEEERRSVAEILEEAAAIYRDTEGGLSAFYRAQLLLGELTGADVPEALAFLESLQDEPRVLHALARDIAGLWAESDGPAAIAWAEERFEERDLGAILARIAESWAETEPEQTYAWYLQKAEQGRGGMNISTFRWMAKPIFKGWAAADPAGAIAALAEVSPEDEDAAVFGIAEAALRSPDPRAALDAIAAMDPGSPLKARLVEELASSWARLEPEAAAGWVDAVTFASPRAALRVKGEIVESWVERDPSALIKAGAWMLVGAPDDMREEIARALADVAARSDRDE